MTFSEKMKTIDNKIEKNKAQFDLDRHPRENLHYEKMVVNMNFNKQRCFTRNKDY